MKTLLFVPALCALLAPGTSAAVDSIVKMAGTIVPSSCTPTILSSGNVDFGAINASTLGQSTTTNITPRSTSLNIACSGSTILAIRITDNEFASQLGTETSWGYGLGYTAGGIPIGHYRLVLVPASVRADGLPGTLIETVTRITWSFANADNFLRHANPELVYGISNGGTPTPLSFTNANFDFNVAPTINSRNALALTQDESMHGSATFEIVYL